MIEEVEYKGSWRLPNSDNWINGTLKFSPETGCFLELFGTFGNNTLFEPPYQEIILGKTTGGDITLVEVWYRSSKHIYNQIKLGYYRPMKVFIGKHFNSKTEIKFREVSFQLFNLWDWFNISGINFDYNDQSKDYSIVYTKPKTVEFLYHNDCVGNMTFFSPIEFKDSIHRIEIEEGCHVSLKNRNQTPYEDLLKDIMVFQGFVTLSTFEQSYPMNITFRDENCFHEDDKEKKPIYIRCLYQNNFYSKNHKVRLPSESLIGINSIKDDFPTIIFEWNKKFHDIEPTFLLLLDYFINKNHFDSEKFLNIVKGLETFHRLKITKKKHLKERLKDLIEIYNNKYIETKIIDVDTFCKDVVELRNDFTHPNLNFIVSSMKVELVYQLTQKLTGLLISCVLKEVGINISFFENGLISRLN
jgi:hypothetical protein